MISLKVPAKINEYSFMMNEKKYNVLVEEMKMFDVSSTQKENEMNRVLRNESLLLGIGSGG